MSKSIEHKYGKAGGVLVGRPHSSGGIKAINKSTDQLLEMEGGEVVITKSAVSDPTRRHFNGQMLTNKEILSRINQSGGGVSFEDGGELPSEINWYGTTYEFGGKTMSDKEIVHHISKCGCQHDHKEASDIANRVLADGGIIIDPPASTEPIELQISDTNPLSSQLQRITGDTYNDIDFESVDGDKLSSGRAFRHKDSGQVFKVVRSVYFLGKDSEGRNMYEGEQGTIFKDANNDGSLFVVTEEGEPEFQVGYASVVTRTSIVTDVNNYKNPYEINRAIEKLLDQKQDNSTFTPEEKAFIALYSGYGGLEKYGAEGKGILYEYYTPDAVVKKMWALAYKYGFGEQVNPRVFEPSVGTGNFLKYAPDHAYVAGNEINAYSARICSILFPAAEITLQSFEQNFIRRNASIRSDIGTLKKYDLVIGNPPYGKLASKYIGMGEGDYTRAGNFTEYFITRGLDLLHPEGLLVFIVGAEQYNGGTLFLDGGITEVKKAISEKAILMDAYRLPTKIFERTGVASEIIVFKKK